MDAKKLTDFKRNKLKYSSAQTGSSIGPTHCFSTRRHSWPPIVYETLRHTTSGIFDPLDDDDDDDELSCKNVEFHPSKSPCCNGRTFDFGVRPNVGRRPWSPPHRRLPIDLGEDSGQVSIEEEEVFRKPQEGKIIKFKFDMFLQFTLLLA
jgi:hypothetical protein